MPAGRPLEYGPAMVTKAEKYLKACQDTERPNEESLEPQAHGGSLKREKKLKVKLPTRGGMASYLGVARETLYDWAHKYPEFSNIMERLGSEQEDRLINNGLSGDYNPTIAKVLLTKHGYREGVEQTGVNGGPIEVNAHNPEHISVAQKYEKELKEGI